MTHFLLVADDEHSLEPLAAELRNNKKNAIHHVNSGVEALSLLGREKIEVVIVAEKAGDNDGLTIVKKLVQKHPLINCAMASSLPPEKFHEVTEGLGIFMQLQQNPGAKEAKRMMEKLKAIDALMAA